MAAAIDHPNVIPVYEAGEEDGRLYIVMRWVEGTDLHKELRAHGAMPAPRAAAIVHQVAGALDAAHAAGLVHRDVKPGQRPAQRRARVPRRLRAHALREREDERDHRRALPRHRRLHGARAVQAGPAATPAPTSTRSAACSTPPSPASRRSSARPSRRRCSPTCTSHPRGPSGAVARASNRVITRALAKSPEDRYPSAGDFGRAALAAAEGRSVTEEERSVARGAAAPTMRREEQLWSGPVDPDERPVEELPPVKTYRARKRPRWLLLGAGESRSRRARSASRPFPSGGDDVPPPGAPVSEAEVERLARSFADGVRDGGRRADRQHRHLRRAARAPGQTARRAAPTSSPPTRRSSPPARTRATS